MFTMTAVSDHTLFIYGGLGTDGKTLSECRLPVCTEENSERVPPVGQQNHQKDTQEVSCAVVCVLVSEAFSRPDRCLQGSTWRPNGDTSSAAAKKLS